MISRRGALRAGLASTAAVGAVAVTGSAAQAAPADAAAAGGEGWISVLDHGAAGDGTTDDTAAIQAALNAAATSSKSVVFPAGRTYKITDQLSARNLTDVVISGYGATVALVGGRRAPDPAEKDPYALLLLENCTRVKLVGLTLHDTTRTYRQNGVRIIKGTGLVIDSVRVQSMRYNGIAVFDATPRTSDDILITNCTTEDTRFGISTNGRDVRIVNNHVAMDYTSTEEYKRLGAHPGPTKPYESDYFDGICVWAGGTRTVIAGNTLAEIGQSAIWTQAVTHVTIANNTIFAPHLHGIEIDGTAEASKSPVGRTMGISITGNTIVNSVKGALTLLSTTDATIAGNSVINTVANAEATCIAINSRSHKVTVTGNVVRQANPKLPAIFVKDNTDAAGEADARSTDVTVAWNTVEAVQPIWAHPGTVIIQRVDSTHAPGGTERAEIATQGTLKAVGKVLATEGLGVGNYVAATSVGAIVRKMQVFSATGEPIGWIPIYNS
ncbi:right-handed parallel beta-helix repeat-containing protein [Catenuloplanes indicus]|uniref:Polygalacturonase n=1 Tax=Catenuloplanes indicus TaxID=137267 RepID=A0AAE3VXW5_9ACTN|nr:right-handed parallel beta-helix repeat-containing protein [Catenuloplanes indicus]MDQ0365287.1 polygalacturonase [Catenuloplanes indicus]